jgi:hypothetical protein
MHKKIAWISPGYIQRSQKKYEKILYKTGRPFKRIVGLVSPHQFSDWTME